jgi:hypothetical protein
MKKLLTLVIVSFVLASCSKENLNNELVTGQWKWEITYTDNPSNALQPAAGEIYILKFNADKTFSYTKNDAPLRSGTYEVKAESDHTGQKEWFLYYSDRSVPHLIYQSDTLLVLGFDAIGAGAEHYLRN